MPGGSICSVKSIVFAVALATMAGTLYAQSPKVDRGAPTLSGMRAYLFHTKTAALSDDVLDPKHGGLWNTIAGPNAANATLVVVEVSDPPNGTYPGQAGSGTNYMVRLVAREDKRSTRLLDQSQVIPVLGDQGKLYVAFLLHQGGCAPIRLTATIVGPRSTAPLERSLNFACGE